MAVHVNAITSWLQVHRLCPKAAAQQSILPRISIMLRHGSVSHLEHAAVVLL